MAAARRNKNQARRNSGSNGTPGWMWLIIGAVLAGLAFLILPGLMKKDGFDPLRPTPNPDAQPPAQIADADTDETAPVAAPQPKPAEPATEEPKPTQYEFYDVLQGKEVVMSDGELAASARAERERAERAAKTAAAAAQAATQAAAAATATTKPAPAVTSNPKPIDEAPAASTPAPTSKPAASAPAPKPSTAPATASTAATPRAETASTAATETPAKANYILQAGAFSASGDAEATKAKIAMLGLSARVESAQISGKTVYRVRMGPYGSASELSEAKQKLANGGLPANAIKVQ